MKGAKSAGKTLTHRVLNCEQQITELEELLDTLHVENRSIRTKHALLTGYLEVLQWLGRQQDGVEKHPAEEELLQQLQVSHSEGNGVACGGAASGSASGAASRSASFSSSPQASKPESVAEASSSTRTAAAAVAGPDAWRNHPIAHHTAPLSLLTDLLFKGRPHPGAGAIQTVQHLVNAYNTLCKDLSLLKCVFSSKMTPAKRASDSALQAKKALLDWLDLALTLMLLEPKPQLLTQLNTVNCLTGEVSADQPGEELYEAVVEQMVLTSEQRSYIVDGYLVLNQLHSTSVREAMQLQRTLDVPASELFASVVVPTGMRKPETTAAIQHQQDQMALQRLRVAMRKACFTDVCWWSFFLGSLTISQVCDLVLSLYPFTMRLTPLAAVIVEQHHQQQLERLKSQQEQLNNQQQDVQQKRPRKPKQRQSPEQQHAPQKEQQEQQQQQGQGQGQGQQQEQQQQQGQKQQQGAEQLK